MSRVPLVNSSTASTMLNLCDYAASRSPTPFEFLRGWLFARSLERASDAPPDPRRDPDDNGAGAEGVPVARVALRPSQRPGS